MVYTLKELIVVVQDSMAVSPLHRLFALYIFFRNLKICEPNVSISFLHPTEGGYENRFLLENLKRSQDLHRAFNY